MYIIPKGYKTVYMSDDYTFKTYIDYKSKEPLYTDKPFESILSDLILDSYDLEEPLHKFVNKQIHGKYDFFYIEILGIYPLLDVEVVCMYKDRNSESIYKYTDLLDSMKFERKNVYRKVEDSSNNYIIIEKDIYNIPISADKDHTAILYMFLNSDIKININKLMNYSEEVKDYIDKVKQDPDYLSDVILSLEADTFVDNVLLFISTLSSDKYPQTFIFFYESDDYYEIYKFILEKDKVIYGKVDCLATIKHFRSKNKLK